MSEITVIQAMLDDLSRLQAAQTAIAQKVHAMKEAAIPDAVRQHLAAIDEEYSPTLQTHLEHIQELELQIRINVLACQKSVKGTGLHAVWNKGRTTVKWDDNFLRGYAAAHDKALLQARRETQGEPSVTLRAVKSDHAT